MFEKIYGVVYGKCGSLRNGVIGLVRCMRLLCDGSRTSHDAAVRNRCGAPSSAARSSGDSPPSTGSGSAAANDRFASLPYT